MMLKDIRDYVESLGVSESVYMGKLDSKPEKSMGVYNSKHQHTYQTAIGGPELRSYETRYVTILVHWNKSPGDTETAAKALFGLLAGTREATVNNRIIKFIQPLYEPQDVGTDEFGVYEMVIEAAFVCGKE